MVEVIASDADDWSLLGIPRRVDQIQVDFRFGLIDDGTLVIVESPSTATMDGLVVAVTPETLEGVGAAISALPLLSSPMRSGLRESAPPLR